MSFISGLMGGQQQTQQSLQGRPGEAAAPISDQEKAQLLAQSGGNPAVYSMLLQQRSQAGPAGQSDYVSAIDSQNKLRGQLETQAAGGGPSVSTTLLNNAQNNTAANANALLAGSRGINPGMALRQTLQANAQSGQQAAQQGVAARQQEQLNAQSGLANLANTQVGQIQQASQSNADRAAGVGAGNANRAQSATGGLLSGIGSVLGLAQGGEIPVSAPLVIPAAPMVNPFAGGATPTGPQSSAGKFLSNVGTNVQNKLTNAGDKIEGIGSSLSDLFNSSGKELTPGVAMAGTRNGLKEKFAKGGRVPPTQNMKTGGKVPGEAKIKGDSLKNDTVPAILSPREIVLPRSVTMSKNAPERAAAFVRAIQARKQSKK